VPERKLREAAEPSNGKRPGGEGVKPSGLGLVRPSAPCGVRSTVQTIPPSQRPRMSRFVPWSTTTTAYVLDISSAAYGNLTQVPAMRTAVGTDSRRPFLVLSALSEILPRGKSSFAAAVPNPAISDDRLAHAVLPLFCRCT